MTTAVVLGLQFGDEGKGKVVDYCAAKADYVVRFQGGNNAGHTVQVKDKTFKLHLLPSGVIREKHTIIGNGLVVDPEVLLREMDQLKKANIQLHLSISDRAHVILPLHKELDALEEKFKDKWAAGTTKRGIGPCYQDKIGRFGIRMCDLIDEKIFEEKIRILFKAKQHITQAAYNSPLKISLEETISKYKEHVSQLRPLIVDTVHIIHHAVRKGKNILFEGAQGALLDIDFGIYPFNTSSNTTTGAVATGSGFPPNKLEKVIGVLKAYTSRVGTGYFGAEITDGMADIIREKGYEYGTTTGRPRRIGWLDLFATNYCVQLNGATNLAITKLDVLGGLKSIKVCVGYKYQGKELESFPANSLWLKDCKPIYQEFAGWPDLSPDEWGELASGQLSDFPKELQEYVHFISDFLKIPICLISVGAQREHTLHLEPIFM
ncbi:MAG: adenylosuccinate synthase [Candidatus Hodarchaeota archaeon]